NFANPFFALHAHTVGPLTTNLSTLKGMGAEGKALEQETRELFTQWKPIRKLVFELMESGKTSQAIGITQQRGARHVAKLEAKMLALTRYALTKAAGYQQEAVHQQRLFEKITIAFTVGAVLLALWVAVVSTRQVTQAQVGLREEKDKLQQALDEIKTLRGIIPICSNCKQIRDDKGSWTMLEKYLDEHSEASFSHGICPECVQKLYPDLVRSKNATDP
ncbi:MAG: hypothetical protein JXR45_02910, partial [Deltaproteobacteria bacterium]|nr:hypothetical protein [Deltaproteobacteria bacterium]